MPYFTWCLVNLFSSTKSKGQFDSISTKISSVYAQAVGKQPRLIQSALFFFQFIYFYNNNFIIIFSPSLAGGFLTTASPGKSLALFNCRFPIWSWLNLQIWRANCTHCTRPFYIRDLSLLGILVSAGLLESTPESTEARLHPDFLLAMWHWTSNKLFNPQSESVKLR